MEVSFEKVEWRVSTDTWSAMTPRNGPVSITRINDDSWACRDENGMLVSAFFEKSFDDAVKFMVEVFWK